MSPSGMTRQRKLNGLHLQPALKAPSDLKGFSGAITNRGDPRRIKPNAARVRGGAGKGIAQKQLDELFATPHASIQAPWHADVPWAHRRIKTELELRQGCEWVELFDRRFPGRMAARGSL